LMSEKYHDIEFFDIHGLQNLFVIFSKFGSSHIMKHT
jgi:hypothetical protein